jgi:hypothetical protein
MTCDSHSSDECSRARRRKLPALQCTRLSLALIALLAASFQPFADEAYIFPVPHLVRCPTMVLRNRSLFASCPMIAIAFVFCGSLLVIFASTYNNPPSDVSRIVRSTSGASSSAVHNPGPLVIVNNKALHLPDSAVIRTSMGDIVLELLHDAAPRHVHNFVSLARSGWYNSTSLYRLEKGFCLQVITGGRAATNTPRGSNHHAHAFMTP